MIDNKAIYKDSPLGKIPNDWEVKQIGELGQLISGLHLNPDAYNQICDGIPYFTGPTDYTNELSQVTKWTTKKSAVSLNGDILITVKGSGVSSLHQLKLERISIGRQIMAFRANKESSNMFVHYCICQLEYNLKELAKGNMIPGLTRSDILTSKILTPPLPEQKAIAYLLGLMDEAINKNNSLIAYKELQKKWIMQNLLTGKKRLKGFANEKWKIKSLEDVLVPVLRPVVKPLSAFLALGIRSHGKGTFLKYDFEPGKIDMDTLFVVRENDLIVNITFAWEGAIAIVKKEDEGALVSHRFPTFTFNSGNGIIDYFRHYILQPKFKYQMDLISPGGAGRNRVLSKKDFLKLEVKIPSPQEQIAIAQVLQAADTEIQLFKVRTVKLREQKKGLMQVLLTGKKRLTVT